MPVAPIRGRPAETLALEVSSANLTREEAAIRLQQLLRLLAREAARQGIDAPPRKRAP